MSIALIVLFGVIGYANTFSDPFQWDEQSFIKENPVISNINYFLHPAHAPPEFASALNRRYIGYLSFALEHYIHGFSVTGYHIVNLGIHLTCAVLVFCFVLMTFRTPFMAASRTVPWQTSAALFTALLFVAHPVQTEAVTYIFQRLASLVSLFFLLSLVAYAGARLVSKRMLACSLFAVSLLAAVFAMKTKENAFTLPVVIVLFELLFFAGPIRPRLLRLVPFLMEMAIVPLSLAGTAGGSTGILHRLGGALSGYQGLTATEYLFTQFRVIVTYLRLLLLPINQNIDYHYPIYRSLFSLQALLSLLLLTALFAWGVYLLFRARAKEPALRLAGFGVLWFFVTLSVESSVVPIPMVMNEYRLYLPSVGLFLAAATGFVLLVKRLRQTGPAWHTAATITLLPLVLLLATHVRNNVWSDEVQLWQDAAEKSPLSDRVHFNLANNYMRKGLSEKGIEQYRITLRLNPKHTGAHNNLGTALLDRFRANEAIEHFQAALAVNPSFVAARNNLGNAYLNIGKYEQAIDQYRRALTLRPESFRITLNMGIALFEEGSYDRALSYLAQAASLNPASGDAQFYLGRIYLKKGDTDEARARLENALRLNPADREAAQLFERLEDGE